MSSYLKNVSVWALAPLVAVFSHIAFAANPDSEQLANKTKNFLKVELGNTTQGPIWPPSALVNADGDFIVVGSLLQEVDGVVGLIPGQAAIVSKNTRPPLDEAGRENFANPLGAAYRIVRHLNLKAGSDDREMLLYTSSYGPAVGDFGGGPRIPRLGESKFNLNGFSNIDGTNCPEVFPSQSQAYSYTRPSYPLHEAPVFGFQGDSIAYDVDTGEVYTPRLKNGEGCAPFGCLGENVYHTRRAKPVTLDEWLRARVELRVRLVDYDPQQKAYTAARFELRARGLLPSAIYTVVATRSSFLAPSPLPKLPSPASLVSHIISDERGRGTVSFTISNPFPARESDSEGSRIIAMALGFKSDYALLGGCSLRFGAGVDIHAVASTAAQGLLDFTDFVTVEPSDD